MDPYKYPDRAPDCQGTANVEITVKRDLKSGQTLILIHEGVLRSARK
jgi:hypothetical protein